MKLSKAQNRDRKRKRKNKARVSDYVSQIEHNIQKRKDRLERIRREQAIAGELLTFDIYEVR